MNTKHGGVARSSASFPIERKGKSGAQREKKKKKKGKNNRRDSDVKKQRHSGEKGEEQSWRIKGNGGH